MSDPADATTDLPTAPAVWARRALRLTAAAGLTLSLFLAWPALSHGPLPGCGGGGGLTCGSVMFTRWARWFGIPVSALSTVLYLVALVASVYASPGRTARQQSIAFKALVASAVMAVGAGVWFMATMLVMRQTCPYCAAAHVCGVVLALLVGNWALRRRAEARLKLASGRVFAGWGHVFVGLGGVAVLIVGQLLYISPLVHAERISGRPDTDTGPGPDRVVTLLSQRIRLRPHDYPILGSPDAKHIVLSLFDYTCPHCRDQHHNLQLARKRYGDQIAIIPLPIPLESKCNPLSQSTGSGSCYRSEVGLALWRTAPAHYSAFDDWMYTGAKLHSPADIRKYIVDLVGEDSYTAGRSDPWVAEQIAEAVRLFAMIVRIRESGNIPLLIAGSTIIQGEAEKPEELFELLEEALGITPTQPAVAAGADGSGAEE